MLGEQEFMQFLKRSGKKPHVVEGLVSNVHTFETILADEKHKSLEAATADDIRFFAQRLDKSEEKKYMRALALYFHFSGQKLLAQLAGSLREEEIAKSRRAIKLREFRGIDQDHFALLASIGIVTIADMLTAGKTPASRELLSQRTGIPQMDILELVKLSDLSRLEGVKGVRARLYYEAGVDTPDKFKSWKPSALYQMLSDFVKQTKFDGIAPLPKEVRVTISNAGKLPPAVEY
ncbi:MAG: DUF4332 domain-containing protein [Anaerolineaceae bacterium]|jgi:hypothetical protein